MTQSEQVLAALQKIGGKGTIEEIVKAIDGIENWKTQTPNASVSSCLTRSDKVRRDGNIWIYDENIPQDSNGKKSGDTDLQEGLYLITLNPDAKPSLLGFLFKIGSAKRGIGARLQDYSASLPYNPILLISTYQVSPDIDLLEFEKQVRDKLLGDNSLGFSIAKYHSPGQNEWFHIPGMPLNLENVNKLALVVQRIVDVTTESLRRN
jgi:hypothetical protein